MLHIKETWRDATNGCVHGDSGVYETRFNSIQSLYRACQHDHGRCLGKVFIDTEKGSKAVGWVFQKTVKYDDCNDTFTQEVWVTIHSAPDEVTVTPHYQYI